MSMNHCDSRASCCAWWRIASEKKCLKNGSFLFISMTSHGSFYRDTTAQWQKWVAPKNGLPRSGAHIFIATAGVQPPCLGIEASVLPLHHYSFLNQENKWDAGIVLTQHMWIIHIRRSAINAFGVYLFYFILFYILAELPKIIGSKYCPESQINIVQIAISEHVVKY